MCNDEMFFLCVCVVCPCRIFFVQGFHFLEVTHTHSLISRRLRQLAFGGSALIKGEVEVISQKRLDALSRADFLLAQVSILVLYGFHGDGGWVGRF